MWNGWMHGGGWGFGILFWVVILGVVVLAIRWAVWRRPDDTAEGTTRHETPLEVLQKRYARGDLSKEEYEQKRRDLSP